MLITRDWRGELVCERDGGRELRSGAMMTTFCDERDLADDNMEIMVPEGYCKQRGKYQILSRMFLMPVQVRSSGADNT